jgi:hypothetical protein
MRIRTRIGAHKLMLVATEKEGGWESEGKRGCALGCGWLGERIGELRKHFNDYGTLFQRRAEKRD